MCIYNGKEYSEGSIICIQGQQAECRNGKWEPLGIACENNANGKIINQNNSETNSCKYKDESYGEGSIICMQGQQAECRNGKWEPLGISCE